MNIDKNSKEYIVKIIEDYEGQMKYHYDTYLAGYEEFTKARVSKIFMENMLQEIENIERQNNE